MLPSDVQLDRIAAKFGVSATLISMRMGVIGEETRKALMDSADQIAALLPVHSNSSSGLELRPVFQTKLGKLFHGDCRTLMKQLSDECFDLIFADPPFNLSKKYPSGMNDSQRDEDYLRWCYEWADECVRLLKPGGSLFIYNLPKWNTAMVEYLNGRLTQRDWIAVDMKFSLPIAGRLYPSHYSLIYFTKGDKPRCFKPDRLPMKVCPRCYADLTDYGGYKDKMNPRGISLSDVWTDIPPVRHKRTKKRKGANELSIRLVDRVIEFASLPGDLVFDPFGGAGTTYAVSELKERNWVGIELGPVDDIVSRFQSLETERKDLDKLRKGLNHLFVPEIKKCRHAAGLWTDETIKTKLKTKKRKTPESATRQAEMLLT